MVPEEIMLEMARPMKHHRTSWYRDMLKEVTEDLQYLFQTKGTCLTFTGSGTAAAEGAIIGCCPPGKKALCARGGKFGERWAMVCEAFGIEHVNYDIEWGHGAKADKIAEYLDKDPSIATVIIVHSETSTAAVSDIEKIAAITSKRGCLLIVDGITAVGTIPVKMDEWGVDVYVTGSQKAMMLPPGLGFAAVNDRAWKRIDSFETPTFYNNIKAYRNSLEKWDAPYTPAVTLVCGLRLALKMIKERGLENIWSETARMARATREAAIAIGMKVFASDPVDSVSALLTPQGIDGAELRSRLIKDHGMTVAGGQDQLKGKIIRISHMGYCDDYDTLSCIAAVEQVLKAMGHKFELGAGLTAAQKVFAGA